MAIDRLATWSLARRCPAGGASERPFRAPPHQRIPRAVAVAISALWCSRGARRWCYGSTHPCFTRSPISRTASMPLSGSARSTRKLASYPGSSCPVGAYRDSALPPGKNREPL